MVVREKKAMIKLIEKCLDELASYEKYSICDAIKTGEKQGTNWRTELLWLDDEDHTTTENTGKPYMVDAVEYRLPKNMDEETEAEYNALTKIREVLADLL